MFGVSVRLGRRAMAIARRFCFLGSLCGLVIASPGWASPSIHISEQSDIAPGSEVALAVTVDSMHEYYGFNGFELCIQFDPGGLQLGSVEPGSLLQSCEWEYFTFRHDEDSIAGGLGRLIIVALAETVNGPHAPVCNVDQDGELAILHFQTTSDPAASCGYFPVRFYWGDCGDNVFSSADSVGMLFTSDRVFSEGMDVTDPASGLPSPFGAPDVCIQDTLYGPPVVRAFDFYNGGIQLSCDTIYPPVVASVRISKADAASLGGEVTLPVILHGVPSGLAFGGFDFLLAYGSQALQVTEVEEGHLLQVCDWEYFSTRYDHILLESEPTGLVRIVAVADLNDGASHPACQIDTSGQLARVTFHVTTDPSFLNSRQEVRFLWGDCGDNIFAGSLGDTLYASDGVFDFDGFPMVEDTLFPTLQGMPDACLTGKSTESVVRMIDYYAGGINSISFPPLDYRGDLNLNLVPYELADWGLFADYFRYGQSVFTIDRPLQVQTTDVNADGLVLTLRDFMYLYGVIYGFLSPVTDTIDTPYGYDTTYFEFDVASKRLDYAGDDSLAAAYIHIMGDDVIPHILFDTTAFTVWFTLDSGMTHVMIHPSGDGRHPILPHGPILSFSENGIVANIEATDYAATHFSTHITPVSPQTDREASVWIATRDGITPGETAAIPFMLKDPASEFDMSGFELSFRYDNRGLLLNSIDPAELITDCDWEYFNYYEDTVLSNAEIHYSHVRVLALADVSSSPGHPTCWGETPATLFTAGFTVSPDTCFDSRTYAIQWFWESCADNLFSSRNADFIYASREVYERGFSGFVPITQDTLLPTRFGMPSSCVVNIGSVTMMRAIDYYNGHISVMCPDPVESRGDINLNGITYEIGDWMLYHDLYTKYDEPFDIDPPIQTLNSDINGDGIRPSLADFILMTRVIDGDLIPPAGYQAPRFDTLVFTSTGGKHFFEAVHGDSLAAVVMEFEGHPAVLPLLDTSLIGFSIAYDSVIGQTRVGLMPALSVINLIAPMNFFLECDAPVVSILAAGTDGTNYVAISQPDTILSDAPVVRLGQADYFAEAESSYVTLPVYLDNTDPAMGFGGFDLLIDFDESLTFVQSEPGDLLIDCDWEYLEVFPGPSTSRRQVRVVAVAETVNGVDHPLCNIESSGTLFSLTFCIATTDTVGDPFLPVNFIWYDCGDNSLSTVTGDTLLLSNRVFAFNGGDVTGADLSIPTFTGSWDWCVTGVGVRRGIDFEHGGIHVFGDTIDWRGDLNLNLIPYEIADWVTYTTLFVNGIPDFADPRLVEASDVNNDGRPFSAADLVYLARVVTGEIAPCDSCAVEVSPYTVLVTQHADGRVTLETPESLGAVLLTFDGSCSPVVVDTSLSLTQGNAGEQTRVLITSLTGVPITSGEILSGVFGGTLVEVEAATSIAGEITAVVNSPTDTPSDQDGIPDDFALRQNYPNPFNPSTEISFDLPRPTHVQLEVFDILGRRVIALIDRFLPAGVHVATWQGRNSSGEHVASGIYFYRLQAGDYVETRRMLLVK